MDRVSINKYLGCLTGGAIGDALGATPVDINGAIIKQEQLEKLSASEPAQDYASENLSDEQIIEKTITELKSRQGKEIMVNEVSEILKLDAKTKKRLNKIFSGSSEIKKEKKGKYNFYHLQNS